MRLSISCRTAWAAAGVLVAAAAVGTAEAARRKADPRTYDVHKKALGRSFPDWTEEWWQWAFSLPYSVSPLIDDAGEHVEIGQRGPVWFLCGTFSDAGSAPNRVATIPSGKALLFPIFNGYNDEVGYDPPLSVAELRADLVGAFFSTYDVRKAEVVVDDLPLVGVSESTTRVAAGPFSRALPTASLLETLSPANFGKGVYSPVVCDGYWVMLRPPSIGHHLLRFRKGPEDVWIQYDLTVVDHDKP